MTEQPDQPPTDDTEADDDREYTEPPQLEGGQDSGDDPKPDDEE